MRRFGTIVLVLAGVTAVALHLRAGNTYPVPWPDEIDFMTPAHQLAHHFTFATPQLRSPQGMLWVPDFFYVVLAPVLRFFPTTVTVGRLVMLAAVLLAAAGFWAATRRAQMPEVPAALVVAVWLLAPRVVLAGNIVRQEAVVLAALAWALWATIARRPVIAVSLAALMVLTHPVSLPLAAVVALAHLGASWRAQPRNDWLAAGAVGLLGAWQVLHFALAWDVAHAQLHFQLARKANYASPLENLNAYVALGGLIVALLLVRAGKRDAAIFLGLGAASLGTWVWGHEIWYRVYGTDTVWLLVALAALALAKDWRPRSVAHLAIPAAFVALVMPASINPYGFAGMQLGRDPGEFSAFSSAVRAELVRLGTDPTPHTILVNGISGLPWPAQTDHIGTLRIVKATIDRPVLSGYDYLLVARTVCCRGQPPVPAGLGTQVAKVTSAEGRFDATIFDQR